MDSIVKLKFESFPDFARVKLLKIRAAIFELADKEGIGEITESLKWGEPSYLSRHGSTVRLSWKPKYPDHVSVYFNCNTVLVETFREIYHETFEFIGNREIKLSITATIPINPLMSCISMSLRYHKIKHLPLLGA